MDVIGPENESGTPPVDADRDVLIRGALRPATPLATRVNRNVLVVAAVIMAATVISAVVVLNPSGKTSDPDTSSDATQRNDVGRPSVPNFLNTPPRPNPSLAAEDSLDYEEYGLEGEPMPTTPSWPQDPAGTGLSPRHEAGPMIPPGGPSIPPFDAYPLPAPSQNAVVSPRIALHAKALTGRPAVVLQDARGASSGIPAGRPGSADSLFGPDLYGELSQGPLTGSPLPGGFTGAPQTGGSPPPLTPSGKAGYHAFLQGTKGTQPSTLLGSSLSPAPSRYTIQAGTVIPGLLLTGINSDLPGQILAQVARDVYDSPTQRTILIPKGAKLLATYDNEILAGQNRVLVAFTRIIFPDGRSITLPGLGITDAQGAAGVRDQVDNHYRRVFGNAILLSVLGAGAQLSQPRQGGSVLAPPSAGQVAAGAVGQQLTDVAAAIVRKNLDIQPTLVIRQGTPFNVFLNGDLTFDSPYVDARGP